MSAPTRYHINVPDPASFSDPWFTREDVLPPVPRPVTLSPLVSKLLKRTATYEVGRHMTCKHSHILKQNGQ